VADRLLTRACSTAATDYGDYLQLDKILNAQNLASAAAGRPAHDEMLFIVIHQAYELWFKLILFELQSAIDILAQKCVHESEMSTVVHRLERVTEIQKILVDQIHILETMFPQDFMDFRGYLGSSSGFQSMQFRMIENKLGLLSKSRLHYQRTDYLSYFKPDDAEQLQQATDVTLLKAVERWLERTPFLQFKGYDFWKIYRKAVEDMLSEDLVLLNENTVLDQEARSAQLEQQQRTEASFAILFNEDMYNDAYKKGERRFSYRAMQAALLIYLYRDLPMLYLPFRMLTLLTDIDELLTTWRYRHTIMVQRMIGVKIGSGGSSGYYYLRSTVSDRYKIFLDLFNLSTYLIPRSRLPELPSEVKRSFEYIYMHEDGTPSYNTSTSASASASATTSTSSTATAPSSISTDAIVPEVQEQ
jgi:tryptophan 2,3-dioxygenase